MKSNKKISVIIPCYNGEKFIDRCMNSIFNQDYSSIECIIIDDGSIDRSRDEILRWKKKFEEKSWKLIYFYQENQGPSAAVNAGLKFVSGKYIILLDVDDEYLPGALKEKAEYLEKHKDVDVVRSNGWIINGNHKYLFIYEDKEKKIEDVFTALVCGKTNNWAGSYMMRADKLFEFYPDKEIYVSRYGQNLQLLLPLVYKRKCGFIDKPHMNYIKRENSLSRTQSKKKSLENLNGYTDIRVHMVEQIIQDESEREKMLENISQLYWRSIMEIADLDKDKKLMKSSYQELKNIVKPTIDDKIVYTRLNNPYLFWVLKVIRKIGNLVFLKQ